MVSGARDTTRVTTRERETNISNNKNNLCGARDTVGTTSTRDIPIIWYMPRGCDH